MHKSALQHVQDQIERFLVKDRHYDIVDFGSRQGSPDRPTHRPLLDGYDCTYRGIDLLEGANVDVIMERPYSVPLPSASVDVILTGQVFEHVPFFWISFLELARVLRTDGVIIMTVPSSGHRHAAPYDCWRYYPDGMRSLAAFANLDLLHASTDFPPKRREDRPYLDYGAAPSEKYWGDTVGVFRKTAKHDDSGIVKFRDALIEWGNTQSDLQASIKAVSEPKPGKPAAPPQGLTGALKSALKRRAGKK